MNTKNKTDKKHYNQFSGNCVIVNGIHAKSGGGVTYLRRILPLLAKNSMLDIHFFIYEDQFDLFYPFSENIHVTIFRDRAGFVSTQLWEQFSLPFIIKGMGADVVFSPANFGPFFVKNHVVLLRNTTSVIKLTKRIRPMFYWFSLSVVTFISLVRARKAIAVSHYAARILSFNFHRFFKHKIRVVHHGMNQPNIEIYRDTGSCRRILAVSDIYIQKNYHTLIAAFSQLLVKHRDLELVIAGREIDKQYAKDILLLVEKLNIGDAVKFLGHLGPKQLSRRYREADLFVFPSTMETFGNPLLEAMVMGLPIVSSNTAAMPEVVGDAGILFNPFSIEDLVKKMQKVIDNPELRAELSIRARERSKLFDIQQTAKQTAEVLVAAAGANNEQQRRLS